MTETTTAPKTHKWEAAGLGKAPFRFVGVETRRGPIRTEMPGGVTMEVGSPGQPMGTCDYCGQGIADCYQIESSDSKRFVVGCDCVRRVHEGDTVLTREVDREAKRLKNERRKARLSERVESGRELIAKHEDSLKALPHPNEYYASQGKTFLDYVEFMLECAGDQSRIKAINGAMNKIGADDKC